MSDAPKLLKIRQFHSRIFVAVLVVVLLVSHPLITGNLRDIMLWLGYPLVIAGAMGRAYCSLYIGGRKNETVVRQGPFSVVRNPLYVFSFLAVVGIGLQSGMIFFAAALIGGFILYYPLVVEKEEQFLLHKFGEPYAAYLREVPRWIPNLKLWQEPETVESMPKFVRKTFMDAALFFLPLPCFAFIGWLQAQAILPVWLTLP